MTGEEVRVWLTAISAVVAALTFAIGFVRHRADVRAKKIFDWQRVVIHEIFEKTEPSVLSFADIRSKYLSEVHAYQGEKIPQKELAASSLRRILISMVADRIVRQYDKDQYSLDCDDFSSMESRAESNEKSRRLHEIYHSTYSEILSNPFKMNIDQLISTMTETKGYRPTEIRIEIEHMLNTSKISKNSSGQIGPKYHTDIEFMKPTPSPAVSVRE